MGRLIPRSWARPYWVKFDPPGHLSGAEFWNGGHMISQLRNWLQSGVPAPLVPLTKE
jgi:hypothetical protein